MTEGAVCPVCNRLKELKKNGTFKAHPAPQTGQGYTQTMTCKGSGKAPK